MNDRTEEEPKTRHDRLAAIAEECTEEIHDPRTRRQLARLEPVDRYAAVTSEGSPESSYASNGNLIVADQPGALAEGLRQDAGEGWMAHGRVWDLDAPWHSWGNIGVTYSVHIGDDHLSSVHVVTVEGRKDGTHLFGDLLDAETFAEAVRRHGGSADLYTRPLDDHRASERLIDAGRARD
jgi:hypothetical protein